MSQYQRVTETASQLGGRDSILSDTNAQVYSPKYDGSVTVARILPALDLSVLGQGIRRPAPFRFGTGPNDYEQWFFPALVVMMGNDNKQFTSFVVCDPLNKDYDVRNNPIQIVVDTLKGLDKKRDADRLPASWAGLVKGGVGKGAPISAPKNVAFMNALILERERKIQNPPIGYTQDRPPCVLQVTKTTLDKLKAEVDMVKDGWNGDPGDLNRYVHGDFTDLRSGFFVSFYKESSDPRKAMAPVPAAGFAPPGANTDSGKKGGDIESFACHLHRNYPDMPNGSPSDFSMGADFLMHRAVIFQDVVKPISHEMQIRKLFGMFPGYKDALVYCLQDQYADMIPPEALAEGRAKLAQLLNRAPVHGYSHYPQPGMPGMPPQQPYQPNPYVPGVPPPVAGPYHPMMPQQGDGYAPQPNPYPAGFGYQEGAQAPQSYTPPGQPQPYVPPGQPPLYQPPVTHAAQQQPGGPQPAYGAPAAPPPASFGPPPAAAPAAQPQPYQPPQAYQPPPQAYQPPAQQQPPQQTYQPPPQGYQPPAQQPPQAYQPPPQGYQPQPQPQQGWAGPAQGAPAGAPPAGDPNVITAPTQDALLARLTTFRNATVGGGVPPAAQ